MLPTARSGVTAGSDEPGGHLVYLLPFFAGGFLYLGASDLLPEAHDETSPRLAFVISLCGLVVCFVAARFFNS